MIYVDSVSVEEEPQLQNIAYQLRGEYSKLQRTVHTLHTKWKAKQPAISSSTKWLHSLFLNKQNTFDLVNNKVQSTLVISNSKELSEILQYIRTST